MIEKIQAHQIEKDILPKKLKILLFTTASPYTEITNSVVGGAEIALRSVAKHLALRGHDVHYVTSYEQSRKPIKQKIDGVNVHVLPWKFRMRDDQILLRKIGFHFFDNCVHLFDRLGFTQPQIRYYLCRAGEKIRFSKKDHPSLIYLGKLHKSEKFNIVHCYTSPPDIFMARWLHKKYGLPYTVRMGGRFYYNYFHVLNGVKREVYHRALKESFDHTAFYFFNSKSLLDATVDYFKDLEILFPNNRSDVLDIGIEIDQTKNCYEKSQTFDTKPEKRRILCVGKFKAGSKRQDLLLEALRQIKDQKSNLQLEQIVIEFAGGGDLLPPLIEKAKKLGIESSCVFYGNLPKQRVCELLKEVDLFAFPTDFEGSSKALAEALLAEVPVIASDIEANRELIESSQGGILFKNDVGDILQKMEFALGNLDQMKERARDGRQYVLDNLAPEKQVLKYEQRFYEILKLQNNLTSIS